MPEDLRTSAFEAGMQMLSARSTQQPDDAARGLSTASSALRPATADTLVRIASRLGVDIGLVEEVYVEGDSGPEVVVATARLEKNRAGATKQLALLLAAARQATGADDDWTSSEQIRETVQLYGKFDSNNFAATIAAMDDVFTLRGRGRDRTVRVSRRGWEQAAELVTALAEGGH